MSLASRARAVVWRVSVGLQLSALYTLLLLAILGLLGWALYALLDGFLVQNTSDRLQRVAGAAIVQNSEPDRGRGRRPDGQRVTQTAVPEVPEPRPDRMVSSLVRELSAPDVTVALLDSDGDVISATPSFSGEGTRPLPTLPDGSLDRAYAADSAGPIYRPVQWVSPDPEGGRQLVLLQQIRLSTRPGSPVENGYLLQVASLDAADEVLDQVRLYIVLGLAIGTALGVVAGLWVTRGVLRPLHRMTRAAEAIAGGDLDRRLNMPDGTNEVARLGGAFDHMVGRLASTLHAQRRFITDASHELRTPLTSLEGLSEMLLMGADRGDGRTIQRTARSMHGELGRMARLVADLLTLSRLDSAAPLQFTSLDAGKLLNNIGEQMTPMAEQREVSVRVENRGPVMVKAEPDRLKQVILNLVDNALRYTPRGGEVRLTAGYDTEGGMARIEVQDTGPGIPAEDLPRIFDRFYRGDPSRTRASGNTGLGLAIARAIVQAHGGTIEAQSPPGSGARFTILLPAEQPHDPPARKEAQPLAAKTEARTANT
jgi:two-component system, OmpR family, sensor kinase